MLKRWYFTLLPMPLLAVAFYIRIQKRDDYLWPDTIFMILPLFLMTLLTPIIARRSRKFAYLHYALICIASSIFLVWVTHYSLSWFSAISYQILAVPFSLFYFASLTSTVFAIPQTVLPYFRGRSVSEHETMPSGLDLEFVDRAFENIKAGVNQVEKSISHETKAIDVAIGNLRHQLLAQQEQQQLVQKTLDQTKIELREYKALADLTKEQRDALIKALGKYKYLDYLVGFILGLLSSALVQYFPKLFSLLQRNP